MDNELQRGLGLAFQLDTDAKALIATVTPDAASQPIDEVWLREKLAASGYGALRYLPDAGMLLLARYNCRSAVKVILAKCVDATLNVTLAPNGLEAYLHIEPAQGGASIARAMVLAALAQKEIKEGLLNDAIDAAIAAGAASAVVIARGRPPRHGADGRFESVLPEVRSRAPRLDESGQADYRDLGDILVVHPGDDLMLRHPPQQGVDGMTLLGVTVPANPGKEVMFSANLPGTAIAPDNANLLQAAISGQPVVVRGGMIVEPVFKIDEVGTASGNIDFDGSVTIHGDVGAGMTVRATGDIQIGGVAESATLEAGGSIVIKGGAMGGLGRKGINDHRIICGGSFNAAYAQQASIEAGDSIFIDDMAMQCELSAINHIRVGNERRGYILGGSAQATLSITAKVIGSPNRVRTRLEIGVNPLMHKQLLEMARDRDAKENQLLEISKLFAFAQKNPAKVPADMLNKARATAAALSVDIAALREGQELLTQKIDLSQQSRVVAEKALHEGVEVFMGNQSYRVIGEHGACAIGLNMEHLDMLSL